MGQNVKEMNKLQKMEGKIVSKQVNFSELSSIHVENSEFKLVYNPTTKELFWTKTDGALLILFHYENKHVKVGTEHNILNLKELVFVENKTNKEFSLKWTQWKNRIINNEIDNNTRVNVTLIDNIVRVIPQKREGLMELYLKLTKGGNNVKEMVNVITSSGYKLEKINRPEEHYV